MSEKKVVTRGKTDHIWSAWDRQKAVAAYSVSGSFSKAAALCGIPENTIRYWSKQEWFSDEMRRADQAETEELKSVYTRIAKRAALDLEDRLASGDEVVTKDGEVIQKKVGARDLAIISGIAADQRRKQLDAPISVAVQSSDDKLLNLMEKFVKFAKTKQIKGEVIDVEEAIDVSEVPVHEVGEPSEGSSVDTSSPAGASVPAGHSSDLHTDPNSTESSASGPATDNTPSRTSGNSDNQS